VPNINYNNSQTTTVNAKQKKKNAKQKQDMHGVRHVDDRDDNRTRSDASVLVWRI
jgi:hypothetical protein